MKHCNHFPRCGGCTTLNVDYQDQITAKEQTVSRLFSKVAGTVYPVIESPERYYYRHKVQLPFGFEGAGKTGIPLLGCYARNSHYVVNQKMCHVQHRDLSRVAWTIRSWVSKCRLTTYNEKTGNGLLRHVVLRRAADSGEILIGLVTNGALNEGRKSLSRTLLAMIEKAGLRESLVVGIVQNINTRSTNVVLGNEEVSWWGRGYLKEKIGALRFKIGLSTFFQINPFQVPTLYNTVRNAVPADARVIDCYCGVGTITQWIAGRCRHVTGIEENIESIRSARAGIKLNGIENVTFIHGDVNVAIGSLSLDGYSCIVLDPPRRGIGVEMITTLLQNPMERVIYVSCNPETLRSDVEQLKELYVVKSVQPVDMFPHTEHIECVAVLDRRK